jgi:uncharacterized membrane protein YciS (DUF1049 family)
MTTLPIAVLLKRIELTRDAIGFSSSTMLSLRIRRARTLEVVSCIRWPQPELQQTLSDLKLFVKFFISLSHKSFAVSQMTRLQAFSFRRNFSYTLENHSQRVSEWNFFKSTLLAERKNELVSSLFLYKPAGFVILWLMLGLVYLRARINNSVAYGTTLMLGNTSHQIANRLNIPWATYCS